MARDDWYRRETWTDEDRADFAARLKRTRKHGRPQYIRIQAFHLAKVGILDAALELLDEYFTVRSGDTDLGIAWLQRAEIYAALGNTDLAIEAFRCSLDAERTTRTGGTNAWLDFPWFIVERNLKGNYDEALEVLNEFSAKRDLMFPAECYSFHATLAILAEHAGDAKRAHDHAKAAIEHAQQSHSGLRYHPRLGLVKDIATSVHQRLLSLSAT